VTTRYVLSAIPRLRATRRSKLGLKRIVRSHQMHHAKLVDANKEADALSRYIVVDRVLVMRVQETPACVWQSGRKVLV
jgi:hypothetical protein